MGGGTHNNHGRSLETIGRKQEWGGGFLPASLERCWSAKLSAGSPAHQTR